jgi:hypothetical protein
MAFWEIIFPALDQDLFRASVSLALRDGVLTKEWIDRVA